MRGKVGTPLTFQLGVNPTFRLEARLLQPDCSRVEVEEPARERRNSSAGEQLVAVKQVTTEHFSSSLIAEIATVCCGPISSDIRTMIIFQCCNCFIDFNGPSYDG